MAIPGSSGNSTTTNLGGYITYNGWTFYSPRFRSSLVMRPVKSEDGRTTLANEYTLTVRGHVTDDAFGASSHITSYNTPANLRNDQYIARGNIQSIRARLSKNGARLQIHGLGFDIDLNNGSPGSLFDTRFGPETKELQINQIGNGIIWEVYWICTFTLAECAMATSTGHDGHTSGLSSGRLASDVSYIGFPFMQGDVEGLTFLVGYSINESGLTQRTINGGLTIAINRASATGDGDFNKVTTVADELRHMIQPDIPLHFKRVRQDWQTSADRRTLKFTIVDEELPSENSYPPGVLDIQLDHLVSAQGQMLPVMATIHCSFDGSIEVVKGYPLADAFTRVILIMQQRLDVARAVARLDADNQDLNPIFVTDVSIRESLYGRRRIGFGISYIIRAGDAGGMLGDLIGRSGLFIPINDAALIANGTIQAVPGVNDQDWITSLQTQGVWTQRGLAGLAFNASQDAIVGPCEGAGGTMLADAQFPPAVSSGGGSLVSGCPSEGFDYVYWDNKIEVDTKGNTAIHSPMQSVGAAAASVATITTGDGAGIIPSYRAAGSAASASKASATSAGSVVTFKMTGRAIRLGKWPETPKVNVDRFHELCNLGQLTFGDSKTTQKRGGKLGTCPIFASTWEIPYTVTGIQSTTDVQAIIDAMQAALVRTDSDPAGSKVGGEDEN